MAITLTVAQQKGGAGKTTLVANLAAWLAGDKEAGGRRVALLDIDPQHSLRRWHALRAERAGAAPLSFSDAAGWRVAAEIEKLVRTHDVVLIDSPPQIDADARRAIRAAGLVVIPMQPSPPDLWAAEGTLKLAREEKRRTALVLNRVPPAGRMRDTMAAELSKHGLDPLTATLGNRAAFAQAFAAGLGVTEFAPRSAAAAEVRAVGAALMAAAS